MVVDGALVTAGSGLVSWFVAAGAAVLRKLSENRVSLCRPATPFSEKWVTLMGSDTLDGERGVSREEMVRRSTAEGWADTVVVVSVGELSTSIS